MGKAASLASLIPQSSNSGDNLTPDQQAMLQFAQQQEQMKETAFYADAGIPFSSGLAYDLGSTGLQTAAAAGQLEQGNAQIANQTAALQGNQAAQAGSALGSLASGLSSFV